MLVAGCSVAKVVFTGSEAQGTHDAGDDAPIDAAPDAPPDAPRVPHVVQVTSSADNAVYGTGAVIPILVRFDSPVMVTGMPAILLNVNARAVFYTSGAGTNTLTYNYTVVRGDVVDRLDYKDDASLSFANGQIFNEIGNADLTLPQPGAPGSLGANKQIAITTGTQQLNYTGALQTFTVPAGITSVDIVATGATGGTSTGEAGGLVIAGGKGAVAKAKFTVAGGQQLTVLVGGAGANKSCGAGGGGGSWVVRGAELLLVAGGGGGGFNCQALGSQAGSIGEAGNAGGHGVCSSPANNAAGGTNGNGGSAFFGGGGGGWLGAGSETITENPSAVGNKYPGAASGGGGGFGGGGGGYAICCGAAGGGGGYSGGSSGTTDGCAGGGGGSFSSGTGTSIVGGGGPAGNGVVTISW